MSAACSFVRFMARCMAPLAFAAATAAGVAPGAAQDAPPVRGVVRSMHQATLSTDLKAVVASIRFREGESFAKGDLLVEFDCRPQEARLAAAKALRKEKAVALKGARYLQGMKAGSTQDVLVAEAQVEQADAEIEALNATMDGCRLEAPFAGAVQETHVRENELPAEGSPVISIVDPRTSEIELIVTSDWVSGLKPGLQFVFRVDETGRDYTAVLRRTAPMVDPVSQTIKVYAEFAETQADVLPGMSGNADFGGEWALR